MDDFIMAGEEFKDRGERPVSSQSLHTQWNKESVLEVEPCTYIPLSTDLPLVIPSLLLFSSDLIIVSPVPGRGKTLLSSVKRATSPENIQ